MSDERNTETPVTDWLLNCIEDVTVKHGSPSRDGARLSIMLSQQFIELLAKENILRKDIPRMEWIAPWQYKFGEVHLFVPEELREEDAPWDGIRLE